MSDGQMTAADAYAVFFGRGLEVLTFDQARAQQLARDLHGEIAPLGYLLPAAALLAMRQRVLERHEDRSLVPLPPTQASQR